MYQTVENSPEWKDDEDASRQKARIAYAVLNAVFAPYGPQVPFTFSQLKEQTSRILGLDKQQNEKELTNTLGKLHDFMQSQFWLNIIEPRSPKDLTDDLWNTTYRINDRTVRKIEIEEFLGNLAQVAGDRQKAEEHRRLAEKFKNELLS